jgi:leucyl/phenylalanyl-tRNA--protein transferase
MITAYEGMHKSGFAHSVETWVDGELVGGLYCIAIGKAVFGESMFSRTTDASKVALAALVAFCLAHDIEQIDCQQNTNHLASLGAKEISRDVFEIQVATDVKREQPDWRFENIYWQNLLRTM